MRVVSFICLIAGLLLGVIFDDLIDWWKKHKWSVAEQEYGRAREENKRTKESKVDPYTEVLIEEESVYDVAAILNDWQGQGGTRPGESLLPIATKVVRTVRRRGHE